MSSITGDESTTADLPIACSLGADERAARGASLRSALFRHVDERQELPDGVRYRFPGSDEFTAKLLAFAAAERTCCTFFRIEVAFEPGLGPIWLTLTGPAGTRDFIQETFEVATSARPSLQTVTVPRISREKLKDRIDQGEPPIIIEVLPEPYYRRAHLPGAINIPVERVTDLAPLLLPNQDAEIVVHCANLTCPSSELAARALLTLGYRHVREYAEGKQDWIDAGYPTEHGQTE